MLRIPFFCEIVAFQDLEGPSINRHIISYNEISGSEEFILTSDILVPPLFQEFTIRNTFNILVLKLPEFLTVGS